MIKSQSINKKTDRIYIYTICIRIKYNRNIIGTGSHFKIWINTKITNSYKVHQRNIPTKFGCIGYINPLVSEKMYDSKAQPLTIFQDVNCDNSPNGPLEYYNYLRFSSLTSNISHCIIMSCQSVYTSFCSLVPYSCGPITTTCQQHINRWMKIDSINCT